MKRIAVLLAALLSAATVRAQSGPTLFGDSFEQDAPVLLYTDLVSGPTSGGENGKGVYLSIFGRHFGSGGLGSRIKVYVGGHEVDNYRTLGASRGRADIQQITVQLGAIGNPAPGVPLPISLVADGVASNADLTFAANPGKILFVDPMNGNDATAVAGDIAKPWKRIQTGSDFSGGAWGQVRAGDVLVLRGGTYVDQGFENYFLRFMIRAAGVPDRSSGTAPTGAAGTGPITLMSYPGETAFINGSAANNPSGALAGLNGQNYPLAGKWIVIAGLTVEGGGYDGPISQEIYGDDWRVVNNELTAFTGVTSGPNPSRMAGITGNGANAAWLGNHIHDIQGSTNEAHGIYIDGDGSYEIAYNDIHDIKSGKGIQLYANGGNGSDFIDDVRIHHNRIRRVTQFGINIADGSRDRIAVFDNVVSEAQVGGIRFNSDVLAGCRVYNNTFYGNNTADGEIYGELMNDAVPTGAAFDLRNNLVWARPGMSYLGGSVGFEASYGVYTRNVWFGGAGDYSIDTSPVSADPLLVDPGNDFHVATGTSPAVDAGSAAALPLVGTDFDASTPRPQGAAIDIGAYEFRRPN